MINPQMIQVVEVRPGASRAGWHIEAFDLRRRPAYTHPLIGGVRFYARESAGTATLGLWDSLRRMLKTIARPGSSFRKQLSLANASAPRFDRRYFVFDATRSRVNLLDEPDPWKAVWATLVATRDAASAGNVVVEVDAFDAMHVIEQLWRELATTDESLAVESGLVDPPAAAPAAVPVRITPAEAAKRKRDAFLDRNWPTSKDIGLQLGSDESGAARRAADLRARGQLLGAWSSRSRTYVHPDCQFDEAHQLRPVMRDLLALLPTEGDDGGWRRVFWLYGSREALDDQAPADLLGSAPERVLALAREEFEIVPPGEALAPTAGAA